MSENTTQFVVTITAKYKMGVWADEQSATRYGEYLRRQLDTLELENIQVSVGRKEASNADLQENLDA